MEEKLVSKGNPKMLELAAFVSHAKKSSRKIILVGISGMDASLFAVPLIESFFAAESISLIVILAPNALKLLTEEALYKAFEVKKVAAEFVVLTDKDEWDFWKNSMVVLHIYLRNLAENFVLAPICANTVAKLANGMCDDLLVIFFFF